MDSDRLNRWLTLGANVGVLIGIILLLVELTQNREMMRAQIRNDIAAQAVERMDHLAADGELADILVRDQEGSELSAGEELRVRFRRFGSFRSWENTYYQFKLGLLDESEYMAQREAWENLFQRRNSYVKYWCLLRLQTSDEFRAELDSVIDDLECN